jgi:hypothetical protein
MAFNVGTTMCFAGIFANMYTFIPSLPVYRRESQNKFYGPLSYYLSHAFYEIPFQVFLTFMYQVIIFWVINMRRDSAWVFFRYFFVFSMAKLAASGVGDLLALTFKKIELVNQAFPMTVVPLLLVSGFAANIKSIAWHMIVYSYLSFFRFTFQGILEIEFEEEIALSWEANCRLLKPNCFDKSNPNCYINFKDMPGVKKPAACNPRTYYDFIETKYGYNLLILLGQAIFFRVLAFLVAVNFSKEANVSQDPIPDEIKPLVENRSSMKYSPSPKMARKVAAPADKATKDETTPLNLGNSRTEYANQSAIGPRGNVYKNPYQKPLDIEQDPLA